MIGASASGVATGPGAAIRRGQGKSLRLLLPIVALPAQIVLARLFRLVQPFAQVAQFSLGDGKKSMDVGVAQMRAELTIRRGAVRRVTGRRDGFSGLRRHLIDAG